MMANDFEYSVDPEDPEHPYYEVVDAYRLRWMDVTYEPGELKVVAYKDGELIGETRVETANEPYRLRLTPDRFKLAADGMDLCYVTIEMVDKDEVVCPLAMDVMPLTIILAENSDPTDACFRRKASKRRLCGSAIMVKGTLKRCLNAAVSSTLPSPTSTTRAPCWSKASFLRRNCATCSRQNGHPKCLRKTSTNGPGFQNRFSRDCEPSHSCTP